MTSRQKKALYNDGDWCFLVTKETWPILRMEMDDLIRRGGVYFSLFKKENDDNKIAVVIYIEDSVLDLMAEIMKIKCRMSNYNVMMEFQCFAADMFDQFNARQKQSIIPQTFEMSFDIEYLVKSKVILEHFPLHETERS